VASFGQCKASLRNGRRCRVVIETEGAEFCPHHSRLADEHGVETVRNGSVPKRRALRVVEEATAVVVTAMEEAVPATPIDPASVRPMLAEAAAENAEQLKASKRRCRTCGRGSRRSKLLLREGLGRPPQAEEPAHRGSPSPPRRSRRCNAIWVLTFEDLNRLLMSGELWPRVQQLTEASRGHLSARLEEIREIRNVVAHNRAAAERTLLIFRDAAAVVQDGVDQFRWLLDLPFARPDRPTLYSTSSSREGDDFVAAAVRSRASAGGFLCERSELFYKLTQILANRACRIDLLLEALSPVRGLVVAVLVGEPVPGDPHSELTIMWPTSLMTDEHLSIIDAFVPFVESTPMDAEPYALQPVQFIADPIIWFEQGV
jgi:hypothetical protein